MAVFTCTFCDKKYISQLPIVVITGNWENPDEAVACKECENLNQICKCECGCEQEANGFTLCAECSNNNAHQNNNNLKEFQPIGWTTEGLPIYETN